MPHFSPDGNDEYLCQFCATALDSVKHPPVWIHVPDPKTGMRGNCCPRCLLQNPRLMELTTPPTPEPIEHDFDKAVALLVSKFNKIATNSGITDTSIIHNALIELIAQNSVKANRAAARELAEPGDDESDEALDAQGVEMSLMELADQSTDLNEEVATAIELRYCSDNTDTCPGNPL